MSAADAAFACALEHWRAESLPAAHATCLEALGHDADRVGAAVLVLSTERRPPGGFSLEPSGRFSHDPRYVLAVAAGSGLQTIESGELSYRPEGGEPVASTIVCLRRSP